MVINKEGETKIAQYGQWDGYPEGQGQTALRFISNVENRQKLEKTLNKIRFQNEKDINEKEQFLNSIGFVDGWLTMEQAEKYHLKFPFHSRDIGAEILEKVCESKEKEIVLTDSTEFAYDGLFCEFLWLIDFSKNTFEGYEGFNHNKLDVSSRFYRDEEKEYYGPVLVGSWDLDNLPTVEEMIKAFEKEEEEI